MVALVKYTRHIYRLLGLGNGKKWSVFKSYQTRREVRRAMETKVVTWPNLNLPIKPTQKSAFLRPCFEFAFVNQLKSELLLKQ